MLQEPFISIPVILIMRGLLILKESSQYLPVNQSACAPMRQPVANQHSNSVSQAARQALSQDTSKMVSVMSETASNLTPSFHNFFMTEWI